MKWGLPLDRSLALHDDLRMLNELAFQLFQRSSDAADQLHCRVVSVAGAQLIDAGIGTRGSIAAGIVLARLCLGDRADVSVCPADANLLAANNAVFVRTDHALQACLGAQYAGWPVQTDDFFAMGSGPMRMARGREQALKVLELSETPKQAVGVLESDKLPTAAAIELIADQCNLQTKHIHLAIAPSTSIAGSLQVVARSIETAMHKLHELKF